MRNPWVLKPLKALLDRGPDEPTAYEAEAARLGLATEEAQAADLRLRQWVRLHYHSLYVPESILLAAGIAIEEWGFPVGLCTSRHSESGKRRIPGGE